MIGCVFGIAAIMFVVGCSSTVELSDHRRFPSDPGFSITPVPFADSSRLDFNAVYYLANNQIPNVTAPGGNYYRFWPNGRVMVTFTRTDGPPSAEEADKLSSAYLGYYRIDGNRIEMEFFAPDPGKGRWSYGRDEAVIGDDGNLVTMRSQMGKHIREDRDVFRRMPLNGLKRVPDW